MPLPSIPYMKPPAGVQINPLHPLSRGLMGYWLFNESAGSRVNDISGHGNHGTLTNMSPNVQGSGWGGSKFGGGLKFDGSNDQVIVPYDSSLEPNYITISAWIYPQTGARYIATNFIAVDDASFIFQLFNDDLQGNVFINDVHQVGSFVSITLNEWHYVVMTYDGDRMKTYLDGVLKADDDVADGTLPADGNDIYISNRAVGERAFNGSIDSVRIYNRALSAAEIKTLYYDPFCNLLRVPVRYVPAAALRELLTTISAVTSTSAIPLDVLRELAATTATSTSTSAVDVDVIRELIATIDTQTGSVAILGVLRELVASIGTTTSLSDIELLISVLRELSATIAVATSTSVSDLNVLREMDATIATLTSMSDADLDVLRELVSTVASVTLTSTIDLLVETLRELSATIATVTSTSTLDLDVLRELASTIAVTTLLSDIELLVEQLRELVTTIATTTSTSTPDMKVLRELEAIIEATTALTTIELMITMWLTSNPTITRLKSEGWFE